MLSSRSLASVLAAYSKLLVLDLDLTIFHEVQHGPEVIPFSLDKYDHHGFVGVDYLNYCDRIFLIRRHFVEFALKLYVHERDRRRGIRGYTALPSDIANIVISYSSDVDLVIVSRNSTANVRFFVEFIEKLTGLSIPAIVVDRTRRKNLHSLFKLGDESEVVILDDDSGCWEGVDHWIEKDLTVARERALNVTDFDLSVASANPRVLAIEIPPLHLPSDVSFSLFLDIITHARPSFLANVDVRPTQGLVLRCLSCRKWMATSSYGGDVYCSAGHELTTTSPRASPHSTSRALQARPSSSSSSSSASTSSVSSSTSSSPSS